MSGPLSDSSLSSQHFTNEVQMVWKPDPRCNYARDRRRYASTMTDKEWAVILPYLPPDKPTGRPRKHSLRQIINGIFYLLQSGCQWDMLPKDFPPWQTVYRYFRDWRNDGTWGRIHDALCRNIRNLEGREESPSYAIVDSQSVKPNSLRQGPMRAKWWGLMRERKLRDANAISLLIRSA